MNPFEEQFNPNANTQTNQADTSNVNLSAPNQSNVNSSDFFKRIVTSMVPVQQLMINMNDVDKYIDRQVSTVFVSPNENKLYRVVVARTSHKFQNYFLYIIYHTDNVESGLAIVIRGLGYILSLLESGICNNIQVVAKDNNVAFVDSVNNNTLFVIPNCTWEGFKEFVKLALSKLLTTKGKTRAASNRTGDRNQYQNNRAGNYQRSRGNWNRRSNYGKGNYNRNWNQQG